MTIAIGHRFKDGILLCADTLLSTGGIRKYGNKIFQYRLSNDAVIAFAISGNVAYAKTAIEKSVAEVNKIEKESLTSGAIKDAIESALLKFYKEHIFPHPMYRSGKQDFQFVAGAWTPSSGLIGFSSTETALCDFDVYEPLGVGADLAEYILHTTAVAYRRRPLSSIVRLMIHVLWAVKEYVEECGGRSEFIVLDNNGKLSNVDGADVRFVEDFSILWQGSLHEFLVRATDLSRSDKDIKAFLGMTYQEIKAIRKKERGIRGDGDRLIKNLSDRA